MKVNNINFETSNKPSYTFLRLVTKISEIDKKTRNYGTDQALHNAEIHMIKAIYENKNIHVTALADKLGVTKGAISQVLLKLQKKGMIVKEKDPKNLSRILLNVTAKGEIAHKTHLEIHKQFNQIFKEVIDGFEEEEIVVIRKFLDDLESKITKFEDLEKIK